MLRDSTPRFVGRSVGLLVTLYFFYDFYVWTSPLLPKWSSGLKYGPCPPARDFSSRVSGLVFFFFFFCVVLPSTLSLIRNSQDRSHVDPNFFLRATSHICKTHQTDDSDVFLHFLLLFMPSHFHFHSIIQS